MSSHLLTDVQTGPGNSSHFLLNCSANSNPPLKPLDGAQSHALGGGERRARMTTEPTKQIATTAISCRLRPVTGWMADLASTIPDRQPQGTVGWGGMGDWCGGRGRGEWGIPSLSRNHFFLCRWGTHVKRTDLYCCTGLDGLFAFVLKEPIGTKQMRQANSGRHKYSTHLAI